MITSVECYRRGGHDEVYVFVDSKLSGILRVDEGEGDRLAETIRQGAMLDPLAGTLDPVAALDAYERTKRAGEGD
jgi:hypothetical protein